MTSLPSPLTWDEYFMRHVYLVASKSKDPRTKIGAVLVRDHTVISEGYNGFPRGVHDSMDRYTDREKKLKFVTHAEHNAILNCARNGVSTLGTVLYTQGCPCHECAKAIIQGGVKLVVYHSQWPAMESTVWSESVRLGQDMLWEAGVLLHTFPGWLKVTGWADGREVVI